MPELPEVETIVRGLAPALDGRIVREVVVREPRLRVTLASDFATRLGGRRLGTMRRLGKYMLTPLDDGRVWLVHLGMTGRLTLAGARPLPLVHDHVVLRLDDQRTLTYNDPRRFGRLDVLEPGAVPGVVGPGVDALDDALSAAWLFARSRKRRTSVKALLMDQRQVAGLGNIYVSELLFRAGVRPRRRAALLTRDECTRIVEAMRAVLGEAIGRGGSSISDYRDGFDQAGSFQDEHLVYDRAGEPCRRCGGPIKGVVVVGRSTFYCPRCQR
ncbi:MAG TPA: bifunctional DNA-formamidopyrimidine glycosylase/DNA-(apurinic or apyrimidinic site) lyase [Candidatus Eisenbacteria bacterium]|nr:bifunctional DNA-formamidopyrimidine glycosylase/DNA-(apurinic or apyrimidinic site) lyase [Candidatus Eisenbacteria bacterium]